MINFFKDPANIKDVRDQLRRQQEAQTNEDVEQRKEFERAEAGTRLTEQAEAQHRLIMQAKAKDPHRARELRKEAMSRLNKADPHRGYTAARVKAEEIAVLRESLQGGKRLASS